MNKNILSIIIIGFLLMGIVSAYSWNDLDDSLLSYYKFDNNDLRDWVGTGANNGTDNGTTNGVGIIQDGRAIDGGHKVYIKLGNGTISSSLMGNNNFTMNFWQYVEQESASASGLWSGTNQSKPMWNYGSGWCIARFSSTFPFGTPKVVGFSKCGYGEYMDSRPQIETITKLEIQRWNMITIVYDTSADLVYFYINGTADAGNPQSFNSTLDEIADVYLGNLDGGYLTPYFALNGTLDEVGVWTRALSSNEVWAIYSNGNSCSIGNNSCLIWEGEEEIPQTQFSGTGQVIYDSMNTAGAGLGIFMQIMSVALPLLVLGLGVVAVIVIIAWSLVGILKR